MKKVDEIKGMINNINERLEELKHRHSDLSNYEKAKVKSWKAALEWVLNG